MSLKIREENRQSEQKKHWTEGDASDIHALVALEELHAEMVCGEYERLFVWAAGRELRTHHLARVAVQDFFDDDGVVDGELQEEEADGVGVRWVARGAFAEQIARRPQQHSLGVILAAIDEIDVRDGGAHGFVGVHEGLQAAHVLALSPAPRHAYLSRPLPIGDACTGRETGVGLTICR